MTQPCTRIVLRVGYDDAKKLGDGFDSFDAKSLPRGDRSIACEISVTTQPEIEADHIPCV